MAGRDKVNVIALVENLELLVPRRLPFRISQTPEQQQRTAPEQQPQQQQQQQQQTRVIELGDRESEIALKRRLNLDFGTEDKLANKSSGVSELKEHDSLEFLRRLPPNTVIIKQVEAKEIKDEKMEKKMVKDESNNERPKKPIIHRIRNKKNSLEVRRNPLRSVAVRKDASRIARTTSSRQRLLAARRKTSLSCSSSSSSGGSSRSLRYSTPITNSSTTSTPTSTSNSLSTTTTATGTSTSSTSGYMSTRSVTRKQGSVGATYEAPTWRDEAEWKEWPAHGMHERPVYHPQFGLAAEYNGRLFASFDGEGYREITSEVAQIEVVRVDPRVESLDRREEATTTATVTAKTTPIISTTNRLQPISTPLRSCASSSEVARYVRQHSTAAAIVRQKLVAAAAAAAASVEKPRTITGWPTPGYGARTYERLHTLTQSLGLTHQQHQQQQPQLHPHHHHYHHQQQQQQQQQIDQIRGGLERLQHLGNLQRLSSRLHRLQQQQQQQQTSGESGSNYAPTTARLLSTDIFRSLQTASTPKASLNASSGSSTAKCLILPRSLGKSNSSVNPTGGTPSSISLPLYGVQGIKAKPKGKLFFVRASDAASASKKLVSDKTSSSSISSISTGVSWAEVSLRKRPDGSPALQVDMPRTTGSRLQQQQPESSSNSNNITAASINRARLGYPPIRLAETTSIFRPRVAIAPRNDPALTSAPHPPPPLCNYELIDQQAEVLDLSKKEVPKKINEQSQSQPMECDTSKVPNNTRSTDLVDYFKNFGADESIDLFEDPKNLT